MRNKLVILIMTLLVAACSTPPARKEVFDLSNGKVVWVDYAAERRGAILFPESAVGKIKLCAEPFPDIAMNLANKIGATGELSTPNSQLNGSGSFSDDFKRDVVQLSKKSQSILFLREALYRLCELSINSSLTEVKAEILYKEVMKAAVELYRTENKEELLNQRESEINRKDSEIEKTKDEVISLREDQKKLQQVFETTAKQLVTSNAKQSHLDDKLSTIVRERDELLSEKSKIITENENLKRLNQTLTAPPPGPLMQPPVSPSPQSPVTK